MFVTDRLGLGIGADFTIEPAAGIFTAGFPRQRQSPFPEAFFEKSLVETSQVADFVNAQAVQILFGDLADAGNLAHVQRSQEIGFLTGYNPKDPVGFGSGG